MTHSNSINGWRLEWQFSLQHETGTACQELLFMVLNGFKVIDVLRLLNFLRHKQAHLILYVMALTQVY